MWCLVLTGGWTGWKNNWDGELDFECQSGQYISRFISKHNDGREDRRWSFECRDGLVSDDCNMTDYVNDFEGKLSWDQGPIAIITGLYSIHDNDFEDRKWKIRYCKVRHSLQISLHS